MVRSESSHPDSAKIPCPICNGSGQVSFFKGVSRFLLSNEDCPECLGMGFVIDAANAGKSKGKRQKKTSK